MLHLEISGLRSTSFKKDDLKRCTTSPVLPIFDSALALASGLGAVYVAGRGGDGDANGTLVGVVFVLAAVIYLASALYGFVASNTCGTSTSGRSPLRARPGAASPLSRRSAWAISEDPAGIRRCESPIDLPACAVGVSVPEARAVLELAEGRDPIAAHALA